MQIEQETIDQIHFSANEAFMNIVSIPIRTQADRDARENALIAITGIGKEMERAGLRHSASSIVAAMETGLWAQLQEEGFVLSVRVVFRGTFVLNAVRYRSPELFGWHEPVFVKYAPENMDVVKIYNMKAKYVCDAEVVGRLGLVAAGIGAGALVTEAVEAA